MDNAIANQALPINDEAKDFYGKTCQVQPNNEQLLVLTRGPFSAGCDLQNYGPDSSGAGSTIDVLQLYKDARPSVVYFQMKGNTESGPDTGKEMNWGGSGFIIEAENGKSLVVTDNHVVAGTGMNKRITVTDTKVVLSDGAIVEGKVIAADPSRDLALVEIDTGEKTKLIKPIAIADRQLNPEGNPPVVSFGQPYTSHTVYTAEGTADRVMVRKELNRLIKPLEGEDPERPILSMTLPVRTGFSGGVVVDNTGKAVGVVDIETSPFTSIATPIDKTIIDDMKKNRK